MNSKTQAQAEMFANRLKKRAAKLKGWAKGIPVTAYRVYDRDIPEIPLCVDLYELTGKEDEITARYACVSMFERPYEKDPAEEELWLDVMSEQIAQVLGIERENVLVKTRKRQRGTEQYEKVASSRRIKGTVREGSLRFIVNLSDYLDTGLFLDHRPLRRILTKISREKRVLNLFAYTGSLSVAAAKGGACFVHTVDLSNTYLAWARDNLLLNGFRDEKMTPTTRADVMEFLKLEYRKRQNIGWQGYDIILLDPPTFSNSKMTAGVLDTNRDWPQLVRGCLEILNPGGVLYFSTNSKRLAFDAQMLPPTVGGHAVTCEDMTERSLPEDFKGHKIHRCWKICLGR